MAEPITPAPTAAPVARSAIAAAEPAIVVDGWQVSARRTDADTRLADLSPLAKVLVRGRDDGPLASALRVGLAEARRDEHDVLVAGSGPGEWTLLAPVGAADQVAARVADAALPERVSVVDVTHGRALLRLAGPSSREILAAVCAIDLGGARAADATCWRSAVAGVITDVIREDRDGQPAWLLHCERSSGAYLNDALLDAGQRHGLAVEGFAAAVGATGGTHEPSRPNELDRR